MLNQLIRSCSSPSLNYSEAKSAESKRDFIHKMNVCLKELRETDVTLQIIERKMLLANKTILTEARIENDELISIFVASVQTASRNKMAHRERLANS
jgi:four helix bundle protein